MVSLPKGRQWTLLPQRRFYVIVLLMLGTRNQQLWLYTQLWRFAPRLIDEAVDEGNQQGARNLSWPQVKTVNLVVYQLVTANDE